MPYTEVGGFNAAAIQAAEDRAAVVPGGEVWFPAGTYTVDAPLTKSPQTVWRLDRAKSVWDGTKIQTAIVSTVAGPLITVDASAYPQGIYDCRGGIIGGSWRTSGSAPLASSSFLRLVGVNDQFLHGAYAFFFDVGVDSEDGHLLDIDRCYLSRNNTSVRLDGTDDVWIGIGDYAGYDYGVHASDASSLTFHGSRLEFSGLVNALFERCFNVQFDGGVRCDLSYDLTAIGGVNPDVQYGLKFIDCSRVQPNGVDWFRIGAGNASVNQKAGGGNVTGYAVGIESTDGGHSSHFTFGGGQMWRGSGGVTATMYGVEFLKTGTGTIDTIGFNGTDMGVLAGTLVNPQNVAFGLKVDREAAGFPKATTITGTANVASRIGRDAPIQIWTASLGSDVNHDLYSSGWSAGDTFRIIRKGGGIGALIIRSNGTTELTRLLVADSFADILIYDNAGTAAFLVTAEGVLP